MTREGGRRWNENWGAVGGEGALRFDVGRSRAARRAVREAVGSLAPGTPIVLTASAPGARRRCRSLASACGVELDRTYLAFPSASAPAYLVEDASGPAEVFAKAVLVAPPRSRFSLPLALALHVVRRWQSWRILRTFAPGRLATGWRV